MLRPLTSLRSLFLSDTVRAANVGEADDVLLALPGLTQLCFGYEDTNETPALPQAVGRLAQLQTFSWDAGTEAGYNRLPSGPWLASLRHAVLPSFLAWNSLGELAAAGRLELLGLHFMQPQRKGKPDLQRLFDDAAYALLDFASEHPSLRRLQLVQPTGLPEAALAAARRCTPTLSITLVERTRDLVRAVAPEIADKSIW